MLGKYKLNEIYNEDCYEALKHIPDKSVDLIVTDPPYIVETVGGNNTFGKSLKQGVLKQLENAKIISGINYEILKELERIQKKTNIYIWCNKKQILDYLKFYVEERNCSFEIMCWCKPDPVPLCGGNYLIDKEFCLYFRKGVKLNTTFNTAFTYWVENKNLKDKDLYEHPTIKPLSIIKTLIENSSQPNNIVLDCFLGSGTTCVAAKETGRRYIGFEIDPTYYQIAKDRLNNVSQQTKKIIDSGQMTIFDMLKNEE